MAFRPVRKVALSVTGLVVASFAIFGVLAPPEHCPQPTAEEIRAASAVSVAWFERNQEPDGTWLYEYDRSEAKDLGGYNITRHAGATVGLYQAAAGGVPGALETADRGVEWAQDNLVRTDDWVALSQYGLAPVGGSALLVAGLAERRFATGDPRYDDLLRSLGRFLVINTLPDGAVIARYNTRTMEPLAESRSKYFTGEVYWAVARLHRLFPQEGFGAVADRIGDYLASRRDDVEDHWPPIADHWAGYGLAETALFPERDPDRPFTDAELNYARAQAGMFGNSVRWVSQREGPWGELVRGSHELRGGGYGVIGEALTGLYQAAQADDRLADLRGPLADRAQCNAGLALDAQQRGGPPTDDGAWFIRDVTRMDDQQHAVSALLRTAAIVELTPSSDNPEPSAWLWGLALIAGIGPLFVAMALPRRADRTARLGLASVGGAVGAGLVLVVAALGGPLLDLLDVSEPAARIGVGVAAGVFLLARMVRRAPQPEEAPDGLVAALVPVAVPTVAAPGLLLLGLSAGADRGAGFVAVCLAIGVALIAGAAAVVPDEGRWRTVAVWAARLMAAAAVLACVLLVVDGVLDV